MSTFPKAKKVRNSRVEYRVVQKEVEAKLEAGYRIVEIHEELINSGKITMCYGSFCDYVRGQGKRLHSLKKQRQPPPPPAVVKQTYTPPTKPNRPEDDDKFYHEKVANLEELVGPGAKGY